MDKLKILVVDDETRMRKLVKDFLVRENYEVIEAGDGEEALDIFYEASLDKFYNPNSIFSAGIKNFNDSKSE